MDLLLEFRNKCVNLVVMIEESLEESEDLNGAYSPHLDAALYHGMIIISTIGDILEQLAKEYNYMEPVNEEIETEQPVGGKPPEKITVTSPENRLAHLRQRTLNLIQDYRLVVTTEGWKKKINNALLTNIELGLMHIQYNIDYEIKHLQQDDGL